MSVPSPSFLVRTVVQFEVALLRTPLELADRIGGRLPAGAVLQSTARHGLAALDVVADRVAEPTARPTTEPPAPRSARPTRTTADHPAPAVPAEDELVEDVAEELLEEQELAPLTGELAENDDLRRVQAELNAKRLIEEQQPPRD